MKKLIIITLSLLLSLSIFLSGCDSFSSNTKNKNKKSKKHKRIEDVDDDDNDDDDDKKNDKKKKEKDETTTSSSVEETESASQPEDIDYEDIYNTVIEEYIFFIVYNQDYDFYLPEHPAFDLIWNKTDLYGEERVCNSCGYFIQDLNDDDIPELIIMENLIDNPFNIERQIVSIYGLDQEGQPINLWSSVSDEFEDLYAFFTNDSKIAYYSFLTGSRHPEIVGKFTFDEELNFIWDNYYTATYNETEDSYTFERWDDVQTKPNSEFIPADDFVYFTDSITLDEYKPEFTTFDNYADEHNLDIVYDFILTYHEMEEKEEPCFTASNTDPENSVILCLSPNYDAKLSILSITDYTYYDESYSEWNILPDVQIGDVKAYSATYIEFTPAGTIPNLGIWVELEDRDVCYLIEQSGFDGSIILSPYEMIN